MGTADQPVSPATERKSDAELLTLRYSIVGFGRSERDRRELNDRLNAIISLVRSEAGAAAAEREKTATAGLREVLPDAETFAQWFHATYEAKAPEFGYETRPDSRTDWWSVPEKNRRLMVATAASVLERLALRFDHRAALASPDAATPAELSSTLDVERRIRELIEAGTLPKNACPGCGCTPDRRWTETWINSSNHDKVIRAGSCHVHGHQCSEYARLSTPPASSETPGEAQGR